MTLKEHKKHADVQKPHGGKYHRNEFTFIGAPCGIIQKLSQDISQVLSDDYSVAFIDADHSSDDSERAFEIQHTDKISFHRSDFTSNHPDYDLRRNFYQSELLIVNGNHFKGDNQFVIINEKKKESLSKKLDRLKNVRAFILDEGQLEIHDYLKENQDFQNKPIFKISDLDQIINLIKGIMHDSKPPLKGLVLAGGKSMRMGKDKTIINYHGKPHREYMYDLVNQFCDETYLSLADDTESNLPVLKDSFLDLGPYGGILSAFRQDPNAAWFTIASDIPLINEDTIRFLVENRDSSKFATCFHNPETQFPEPLITIWEPRIYPRLLDFLANGFSCPRKALINSDIKELKVPDEDALLNANTPEESKAIMDKING